MSMIRPEIALRAGKIALFCLCLVPLGQLVWRGFSDGLGANPVEFITHATGDWTLRLLLATLALTPLRQITGAAWPIRVRRMVGLFAFFYAVLHLVGYLWLDRAFDWPAILQDVGKRPYIMVGFAAFLLLIPLAVTSTRGWIRRLGGRWKRLHQAIYLIAILGVLHYLWLVKADIREPLVYGFILAGLLAFRVPWPGLARRVPGWAVARPREPVRADRADL
jgi:sulfoxide reductase heme-binding subunit YedZ